MQKLNFTKIIDSITKEDPRYEAAAYHFVREGLDHTLKTLRRSPQGPQHGHVSGRELLEGLRAHTLGEFGPMSKMVLNEWGIYTSRDFGHIVFNLVQSGILGKSDTDSIDDFNEIWSFDEAFVKPFLPTKNPAEESKTPQDRMKKGSRPRGLKMGKKKLPKEE